MPRLIGIDEAGYGPTLGPLVVGATLWNLPPKLVKADFWDVLKDCVSRTGKRGEWRLLVDDSKSVYNRKKGISTLERPVLAFAQAAGAIHPSPSQGGAERGAAADQSPSGSEGAFPNSSHLQEGAGRECDAATVSRRGVTLAGFLAFLGAPLDQSNPLPWYRDLEIPLPLGGAASKFQAVGERLSHTMTESGLICRGLAAAVVTEDQFNQRVNQTRNKAAVLIEQILRIIHNAGRQGGDEDLIVRVDRLGGREDYRPLLSAAFPERHLHIIDQSEECSRYRLAGPRNDWYIEFAVDADKNHLPVALGSMVAKYVREALMTRFNAYWLARCPSLRPTAGYYTDAQRFLADIGPSLANGPIPPERFIRSR